VFVLAAAACTFENRGRPAGGTGGDVGGDGTGGRMIFMPRIDAGPMGTPCVNLQCQQTTCTRGDCKVPACTGGATTTVSGTVYTPAGNVPLYDVQVFVPNVDLPPVSEGASCLRCDGAVGSPVSKATTDAQGRFVLPDVPVGTDIPLVIQTGKWRRQTKIPNVAACTETPLDAELTRLPRTKDEGNIPKIALVTGGLDAMECLLRKIGVADTEFTPEADPGRINLFAGGTNNGTPITRNMMNDTNSAGTDRYDGALNVGATFTNAQTWWESTDNLNRYDMVLLSCEGLTFGAGNMNNQHMNKSAAALTAMQAYADAGGRVFASHWHNYWIERGPAPWPTVATFNHRGDPIDGMLTALIDTNHDKGMALQEWLQIVGATTTPGQLPIIGAKLTVSAVNTGMSQRWAYHDMVMYRPGGGGGNIMTGPSVQYFSFLTPAGSAANMACGKVVFSDMHVSAGSGGDMDDISRTGATTGDPATTGYPFPTGCRTTQLSPQEKALLFIIFDLGACLPLIIG
jgi:hypothetical protein